MEYKHDGNRLLIKLDDLTELDYNIDNMEDKLNRIPVSYLSSLERDELIKKLKVDKVI